jgi:serine/threonine protein kinase
MDPSQLQPGYRLDRYELLCPLAYGGMASVWLARFGGRLGFERMVVIKMILPQYSQDPRFQEMFLDEARIASKIEHANVARIMDVGEDHGNYYIVMEWVDGDSLSKILRAAEQRKEKIPAGVALRICADAAAGLHAAHELQDRDGSALAVVHRDVSPQNILVGNNGATSVIDFGVAKARDRVSQETSAGQLKGKIRYMAPEQALGKPVDRRADVWAIGAMLFEMFTGNPPYDGANEVATLRKLTTEPPPRMPDTFPEAIRAVVDKALGYEAEDRFDTALELNLALEGAMVEIGEPTTTAIVAHYTGQLLQDRKAARRRAVDLALEQAKKRDQGAPISTQSLTAPLGPISQGTLPLAAPPVALTPSAPQVGMPAPPDFSPSTTISPSGGGQAAYAQHGLGESPSATSNATLGSANIEYPPGSIDPSLAARRRRYIGAATLGVFGAAALVGIILIVVVLGQGNKDGGKSTAKSAEPPPPAVTALTPASEPTPTPAETVAAAPDPAPAPAPTPSETAPAPTNPTAAHVDTPKPPAPFTQPQHKWPPAPAPAPAGKGGKKPPDRGF